MRRGAERLAMPVVPAALFDEAVDRTIRDNLDYGGRRVNIYTANTRTHPGTVPSSLRWVGDAY